MFYPEDTAKDGTPGTEKSCFNRLIKITNETTKLKFCKNSFALKGKN